jgi:hypothetical protein
MDSVSFFSGVVAGWIPAALIGLFFLFFSYRKYVSCRQERDDLHARAIEAERRVRWYQVKGCAPPTGYAPTTSVYPVTAKKKPWTPRPADASLGRIGAQPSKRFANRAS